MPRLTDSATSALLENPAETLSASTTQTVLDRLGTVNAGGLRHGVAELDTRLRALARSSDGSAPVPTTGPPSAWLRHPGILLRARAGMNARLQWLTSRPSADEPFAEPTSEDMVRQLVEVVRFGTLDLLGVLAVYSWTSTTSPAARKLTTELGGIRLKLGALHTQAFGGRPEAGPALRWPVVEGKLNVLAMREAALVHRLARLQRTSDALADAMERRLRAIVAEVGSEVIARGLYVTGGHAAENPLGSHPALEAAREALERVEQSIPPHVTDRARVVAEVQAPHRETIRRVGEMLAAEQAERAAPLLEDLARGIPRMAASPTGWRSLGEAADRSPEAFPDGFAGAWLGAALESLLEVGAAAVVEALDAR